MWNSNCTYCIWRRNSSKSVWTHKFQCHAILKPHRPPDSKSQKQFLRSSRECRVKLSTVINLTKRYIIRYTFLSTKVYSVIQDDLDVICENVDYLNIDTVLQSGEMCFMTYCTALWLWSYFRNFRFSKPIQTGFSKAALFILISMSTRFFNIIF